MSVIQDEEFGEITVRRNARSVSVKVRLGTDGRFLITAPKHVPVFYLKGVIATSRTSLRSLILKSPRADAYVDGQMVGRHHQIAVVPTSMVFRPAISITKGKLLVKLPPGCDVTESAVQAEIRDAVIKILRKEAKAYLPERLRTLSTLRPFQYERVRFSHAAGRWGSCSSNGTISLNIALMKLPDNFIDYVLIHELCHTVEMNHSTAFWELVATYDPHYKVHRRQIKASTPSV